MVAPAAYGKPRGAGGPSRQPRRLPGIQQVQLCAKQCAGLYGL